MGKLKWLESWDLGILEPEEWIKIIKLWKYWAKSWYPHTFYFRFRGLNQSLFWVFRRLKRILKCLLNFILYFTWNSQNMALQNTKVESFQERKYLTLYPFVYLYWWNSFSHTVCVYIFRPGKGSLYLGCYYMSS